ncbi:hypothetical protein [Uliginosibacterium sp. TH139]|uniref:hypothetical protein n=1 Tax=Uliginosibacterium sp. TH139 TaxID=2067453 RepID=UPI000C7BD1DB|nr:hypothetical protein [Uliginosibacterium sp. TH139]PLK46971.1 hypothetical protein C0V76_19125 [Uliginosibacterium sp. TH139]
MPETPPHSPYLSCFYKQPGELHQWLQERTGKHPRDFALYILKTEPGTLSAASRGPFAFVLREHLPGLDEGVITRYQRLSEGAHFEHPPCCIDLLATCAVADALSIQLRGLVIPRKQLQRLELGTTLIPEAMHKPIDFWQPDNLLYAPHETSPWLQGIKREASEWLLEAGLEKANSRLHFATAIQKTIA